MSLHLLIFYLSNYILINFEFTILIVCKTLNIADLILNIKTNFSALDIIFTLYPFSFFIFPLLFNALVKFYLSIWRQIILFIFELIFTYLTSFNFNWWLEYWLRLLKIILFFLLNICWGHFNWCGIKRWSMCFNWWRSWCPRWRKPKVWFLTIIVTIIHLYLFKGHLFTWAIIFQLLL